VTGGRGGSGNSNKKGGGRYRPWAPGTILEEEEGIEGEKKKRLSRCCLIWIGIFFTIITFFAGAFIFWLVTMPKSPHVTVEVRTQSALLLLLLNGFNFLSLVTEFVGSCSRPVPCPRYIVVSHSLPCPVAVPVCGGEIPGF